MAEETLVDTSTNSVDNTDQVASSETEQYEQYREEQRAKRADKPVESAPVEKKAPESAQAAKGEGQAPTEDGEEKHRPSGYKRLKEERDRLKAELDEARTRPQAKEPEASKDYQPAPGEPTVDQFDSHGQYMRAWKAWDKAEDAKQQRLDAHESRMAEAKKSYGDKFDEAIGELDGIKISTAAHDALIESDLSGEILFYLGTNAEEAEKLSALDAVKQIKEIGRIEAKLALSKEAQPEKPAPKAVKGPPAPIKPLTGGKSPGASATDWMGADDYEVYRAGRKRAAAAQQ